MRTFPVLAAVLLLAACRETDFSADKSSAPRCAPDAGPVEITGAVVPGAARSYRILPFEVAPGTRRIELAYGWTENPGPPTTPLTATTLDLGLWDTRGYREPGGFRGWGGSRQGRLDRNQPPVFIEAARAERGFIPGRIEAGIWYAELGVGASSPQGARFLVRIECRREAAAGNDRADPVDSKHLANAAPGWYHGDFHMHGYHSHPQGPENEDFIQQARAAGLDFLMVTEYVTGRHWETLGSLQRLHPDLLIWPGREIITYHGHANTHGETPQVMEYRHGFEDVDLGAIQRAAKRHGALFQVNHPTFFPPPVFSNLCRGCYFELADVIDWHLVDTLEILTGPVIVRGRDAGLSTPGEMENPFMQTAIDLWEDRLRAGYRITAVSGSDSKGVDPVEERARVGYGSSATAVYSANLSRAALTEAIQAGRAYVRTRGVAGSPALEFLGTTADGREAGFGEHLGVAPGEIVRLRSTVIGGAGQRLRYFANGELVVEVPVVTDPFVHEWPATRLPGEGSLGTFWRIETLDARSRTAIGNPIFLRSPAA